MPHRHKKRVTFNVSQDNQPLPPKVSQYSIFNQLTVNVPVSHQEIKTEKTDSVADCFKNLFSCLRPK